MIIDNRQVKIDRLRKEADTFEVDATHYHAAAALLQAAKPEQAGRYEAFLTIAFDLRQEAGLHEEKVIRLRETAKEIENRLKADEGLKR